MCKKIVCILLVLLNLLPLCACASGESAAVQVFSEREQSGNGLPQFFSNLIQKVRDVLNNAVNCFLRFIANKVLPLFISSDRSRLLSTNVQAANTRMEEVASAINAKDRGMLKQLFSELAQEEDNNLDAEIDELFEFISSKVISWERDSFMGKTANDYGKKTRFLRSVFVASSDNCKYYIVLYDYFVDTRNVKNEGLYMLEVSRFDYDGEWSPWQNRMRAGISIVK